MKDTEQQKSKLQRIQALKDMVQVETLNLLSCNQQLWKGGGEKRTKISFLDNEF